MAKDPKAPLAAAIETKNTRAALELFQRNLAAMRLWYRKAATPGMEAGLNVVHELVLANVMTALEYALEGKEWIAPHDNP